MCVWRKHEQEEETGGSAAGWVHTYVCGCIGLIALGARVFAEIGIDSFFFLACIPWLFFLNMTLLWGLLLVRTNQYRIPWYLM